MILIKVSHIIKDFVVKWLPHCPADSEVRGSNLTFGWFNFFSILKDFGFYK